MTKPTSARTAPTAPPDAPTKPKGWTLALPDEPRKTRDQLLARVAADGLAGNARTLIDYGTATFGELSLTDCALALKQTAQGLNGGDFSAAVGMLSAQAVALNAVFGELARRAALNMGGHMDATERYMRLALKAQGQCRATLETLAAIKNPPVVFARQANINNGGQQQVNNGATPAHAAHPTQACASAHPKKVKPGSNELLEDTTHGRPQMDAGATAASGRTNQGLEPVGAFNRPANR